MDNIFYKIIEINNLDKKRSYFNTNIKTIKNICKYIQDKNIKLDTPELKKAGGYIMHRIVKDKSGNFKRIEKAQLINCLYKAGADLNYKYRVKCKQNIKITDDNGVVKITEKEDEHSMTIPEMIKFYNSNTLIENLDNEIKKMVVEARDFIDS